MLPLTNKQIVTSPLPEKDEPFKIDGIVMSKVHVRFCIPCFLVSTAAIILFYISHVHTGHNIGNHCQH